MKPFSQWTDADVDEFNGKTTPQATYGLPKAIGEPVTQELPFHNAIIAYCNSQWPRWKYIHANPSQKSSIAIGAQDFTLFLPNGRVLCIECKAKDGKMSDEQLAWQKEMQMLGHTVHVVSNFDSFLSLL